MARKETVVTITDNNRDHGNRYHITEMSASQAEAWGTRLLLALSKAGVEVPDNFFVLGMAGVAIMGIKALAGLSWDVSKPLLDEMMSCVEYYPNPEKPLKRGLIEDDIQEVSTRLTLRDEVIKLHTNFSVAEFISNLKTMGSAAATTDLGDNTEMSQSASEKLSPAA